MSTALRLAAFAAALAVTFGAAAGLGGAVGPVGPAAAEGDAVEHEMAEQVGEQPHPQDTREPQ